MTVDIEVAYENKNKIFLKKGRKKLLLIDDNKKVIKASEIYEFFDYKKQKEYVLKELSENKDISEEFKCYVDEIHKMIDSIIKDIKG